MNYLLHTIRFAVKAAVVTLFVLAVVYLSNSFFGPLRASLNFKNLDQTNLFSVDGEGTASVKPDLANITMGFVVTDASVTSGQKRANEVINNVTNNVKALGVSGADVKTTSYNIYPNYNYNNGRQSLNGYTINIEMSLKVRNFDVLNKVIDSATAAGINQISGVAFDVENKDDAMNLARQEAVKAAKAKAARLSGLAGIRLGRIVNVRETPAGSPIPYMSLNAAKSVGGASPDTQVQPGQTEIKVNVTLDYETL